jgi:hypothetical protein
LAYGETRVPVWFPYSKWIEFPDEQKFAYVAGALDSMILLAPDDDRRKASVFYSDCLSRSSMNLQRFTRNLEDFVRARPEFQGGSVPVPMARYLEKLCGMPPE